LPGSFAGAASEPHPWHRECAARDDDPFLIRALPAGHRFRVALLSIIPNIEICNQDVTASVFNDHTPQP
jgi:hypothetical protein